MTEPARLRVVPDDCENCQLLEGKLGQAERARDGLQVDLENAEVSLRVERRKVKRLESELADKLRSDDLYPDAWELFEFWRTECRPKARTFDSDRLKNTLARLKDTKADGSPAYSKRYIAEAIRGARWEAYTDPKGKRHDDLELICRSGRKLEDFHDRYERYLARAREAA